MLQSCCASRSHHFASETSIETRVNEGDLTVVDLSNLNLHNLPDVVLNNSDQVEHLILDENDFDDNLFEDALFPNLRTLSLNSNQIKNIGVFLQFAAWKCPNLTFLSLIGNPGWPHPLINNTPQLYKKYALTAISFLPHLLFLDSMPTPRNNEGCSQKHVPPECVIN